MEYAEEILAKADFSIEGNAKQKVFDKLARQNGIKVRDISFDQLVEHCMSKTMDAPEEKRTKVFRELVKEGAAKRRDVAAAQSSTGRNAAVQDAAMNNNRAIVPQ